MPEHTVSNATPLNNYSNTTLKNLLTKFHLKRLLITALISMYVIDAKMYIKDKNYNLQTALMIF